MDDAEQPTALVIMGPSGVGKSTTAELIAARLGWPFAEADEFHPKANIEKMTSGVPLNDEDRAPWLAAIRDWITREGKNGVSTVLTCSALKRSYRDILRQAEANVRFVALEADPELVSSRLELRQGHYMPKSLLKSQFADFQPLQSDENGLTVPVIAPPDEVVRTILTKLGLEP